ncbi:TetR/AcrR family transcriptional regulator [Mycobacterium hackensackense]|uniref:TetR/AcrR family transcriptional regulator n=1 Tax=Mycobacterium hackensackense TaxID=228909 RepID=UPI0022658365|nr:TetR/AcrR family transcriptional regulator [Mycobacterium hackensackense]MCV7252325.1 TetR/AcrR family transcriptional regulator [Mycobacterium hackensackense]
MNATLADDRHRTPSDAHSRRGRGRPPASVGDQTCARIIGAARSAFAELGYDATTFREVADRAELTRPCVNYYFASKRVLYRVVAAHSVASVMTSSIALARRERGVVNQLTAFVAYWARADDDIPGCRAFLAMSLLDGQRDKSLRHELGCGVDELRTFLSSVVSDAMREGELSLGLDNDDEGLVEALLAIMCGVLIHPGRGCAATLLGRLLDGALCTFASRPAVHCDQID